MRPLYRELAEAKLDRNQGNAGLWYDKYCNQWCNDPEKTGLARWSLEAFKDRNPKLEWIREVAKKITGEETLLSEAAARHSALLLAHDQTPLFFQTDWHFVTGLGREHPVENGFAWHHGLGVPYLPGSSVKGMVRAWAEFWDDANRDDITRIFGPRLSPDSSKSTVGSVVFLDALPTKPVTLKPDIMTPHYAQYYQDPSGAIPPADWHSPAPIPFLVVAPETSFHFGLLPRRRGCEGDVETVLGWLADALGVIGCGAKTAVGHGRMKEDPDAEKEFKEKLREIEQQRLAQQERDRWALMTPNRRRIEELRKLFEDQATRVDDKRKQRMVQLREQLLKDALLKWTSQTDRAAVADLLENIYNSFGWGKEPKKQEREAAIAKLRQPIPG